MGITFLNGIFGLALTAIGLPILIHLLNRRRARRVSFSSLEFLQEVTRQQRRRVQLRQWLLLLLRCLVVALVVLAMMRPAIRTSFATGGGNTAAIFVFDTSYSMSAATEKGSHRDRALERLADIARAMKGGDRAQLVLMGRPPEVVFDSPTEDVDRVQAMATRAPISYRPAAGREALAKAVELLETVDEPNREIYVISDFQEADWPEGEITMNVPAHTRLYLVPVAEGDLPNVAISAAAYVGVAAGSSSGAVRVSLRNHTDQLLSKYPIQVFESDRVIGDGTLEVPANESATTDLLLTASPPPGEALEVRIPEDALSVDDIAWITPSDRRTIRVLLVNGAEESHMGEEPYLRLALDPPGQAGERPFTVKEIPLRDLAVQANLDVDVLILDNVERVSESVATKIRLAHKDGLGLLVILGDRVDLRAYNTTILPGLMNVTLDEPVSKEGSFFTLTPEVLGHPVFEGFRVSFGEDVTAARFRSIIRAKPRGDTRVLARFGELPALLESEGVLLFTSSADLRWGNFPTGGSFLPFFQQAVMTLASRSSGSRQFQAGVPIRLELPPEITPAEVTCTGPDGQPLGLSPGEAGTIVTDAAPNPGIYRFEVGGNLLTAVSVHLDPEEGHLHYADARATARAIGDRAAVLGEGESIPKRLVEARNGREVWREILLVALLLLIAETIVGRVRFA